MARAPLYLPTNDLDNYNDKGGTLHGLLADGPPTLFVGPNSRLR